MRGQGLNIFKKTKFSIKADLEKLLKLIVIDASIEFRGKTETNKTRYFLPQYMIYNSSKVSEIYHISFAFSKTGNITP